ncbi:MAG: hypothetical protein M4579_000070 [Chaenotheca gracillima]|nr:MAG: hypothetical protein M4579_000070 [Chaenotheca gracillima]
MAELQFAKQFLTVLDSRPVKIPSDHVEDPRRYPAQSAYILPKMPRPMKRRKTNVPGQESAVDVSLRSLRNPPLDIRLPNLPISTSVYDLKQAVSEQSQIPRDKIRLLFKKKPCPDSKVIKDLVEEGAGSAEFSVMVIGGAAATTSTTSKEPSGEAATTSGQEGVVDPPVAQGPSGTDVLQSEDFWEDLRGFLMQRLRDEGEAQKISQVFKQAWETQASH